MSMLTVISSSALSGISHISKKYGENDLQDLEKTVRLLVSLSKQAK